jgi:hypothetical protein
LLCADAADGDARAPKSTSAFIVHFKHSILFSPKDLGFVLILENLRPKKTA